MQSRSIVVNVKKEEVRAIDRAQKLQAAHSAPLRSLQLLDDDSERLAAEAPLHRREAFVNSADSERHLIRVWLNHPEIFGRVIRTGGFLVKFPYITSSHPPHPSLLTSLLTSHLHMPLPKQIMPHQSLFPPASSEPFGGKNGVYGFILPHYAKESLRDHLPACRESGDLSFERQLKWSKQVCSALMHITSEARAFYSDLRPDNILLTDSDGLLLIESSSVGTGMSGQLTGVMLTSQDVRGSWQRWNPIRHSRGSQEGMGGGTTDGILGKSVVKDRLCKRCSNGCEMLKAHIAATKQCSMQQCRSRHQWLSRKLESLTNIDTPICVCNQAMKPFCNSVARHFPSCDLVAVRPRLACWSQDTRIYHAVWMEDRSVPSWPSWPPGEKGWRCFQTAIHASTFKSSLPPRPVHQILDFGSHAKPAEVSVKARQPSLACTCVSTQSMLVTALSRLRFLFYSFSGKTASRSRPMSDPNTSAYAIARPARLETGLAAVVGTCRSRSRGDQDRGIWRTAHCVKSQPMTSLPRLPSEARTFNDSRQIERLAYSFSRIAACIHSDTLRTGAGVCLSDRFTASSPASEVQQHRSPLIITTSPSHILSGTLAQIISNSGTRPQPTKPAQHRQTIFLRAGAYTSADF
ncbi:uncharacterized protein MYCFIDRAFT_207518 [Pseudocercospora fijiensis CIRAD86]|uniref:Protein kinase domain-containing protein n=1 Tax=Pseudocercospora fijiensis (strain CIRAD86) TaxID=383855 RepID=M3B7F7_PSEFD|nr:uncharacterized protein MYCFIDRAFT_207518 [Pseudocercospora fijiensis CIRAD86]EME85242.1 hypothetical protein MYCFIDRAFT_207518 [Pseudocercospora fijiensis CIRAD86]